MAYQESSYGPRSTYAGPTTNTHTHTNTNTNTNNNTSTNNLSHFPPSFSLSHPQHQQQHQQQQQQHPHFYSNNPPSSSSSSSSSSSYHHPQSSNHQSFNHPNATSPPPLPSYQQQSQPSEPQSYQASRLPYASNQNHHAGQPLMQPPMSLPDDHFKKPYLPQQQYLNHGSSFFSLFLPARFGKCNSYLLTSYLGTFHRPTTRQFHRPSTPKAIISRV